MAYYQYDGYCYSSIGEIEAVLKSSPSITPNVGVASVDSMPSAQCQSAANYIQCPVNYSYKAFNTNAQNMYVFTRSFPVCSSVGWVNNQSGLIVSDVVELSWLVVSVWVAAWSMRLMRGR